MSSTSLERRFHTKENIEAERARQKAIFENAHSVEAEIETSKQRRFQEVLEKRKREESTNGIHPHTTQRQNPFVIYTDPKKVAELVRSQIESEVSSKKSPNEQTIIPMMTVDGKEVLTIPQLTLPAFDTPHQTFEYHQREQVVLREGLWAVAQSETHLALEMDEIDNNDYWIELFDLEEQFDTRLRLSGHLQTNVFGIPDRMVYMPDETKAIHYHAKLLTDKSLEQVVTVITAQHQNW